MKQRHKLSQEQQAETAAELNLTKKAELEFSGPETLLRHDAAQVVVPPAVAERLRESAAGLETPRASWWRRWFRK